MPRPQAVRWTGHWPLLPLLVLAALTAVLARAHLFPALSWNRDEPVYLWNLELLLQGQVTAPDGGFPNQLGTWLSATEHGQIFTQYTPGWPLVLLAAHRLTSTAAAALPLSAMLAVGGTYALTYELTARRRPAVLAAVLLLASPILALQSGVYLSYVFTLGVGFLAGALLLSGARLGQTWRSVVAGLLLGWIFLTRPYDALLWGAAFSIGALLLADERRRAALRAIVATALAAVPLVIAALLYNRHVTGAPLRFPITAADPLDTFGFGTKRLMPGFKPTEYTLGRAVRSTGKNALVLPWFLVGGYLGVALAACGAWIRRRDRALLVLVAVMAVWPLGYFVFFGTYISSMFARISGPIYFVPVYGALCILGAFALDHWWGARRAWVAPILVVLLLATLPGAITRFGVNRELSQQQQAWSRSVADLDERALVLVADTGDYLLYTNPSGSNGPDLDDRILFAAAGEPEVLDLIEAHPDRAPFLQSANLPSRRLGPREDPRDLRVSLVPVEVVRGTSIDLLIAVDPPDDAAVVDVVVSTGAADHRISSSTQDLSGSIRVRLGEGGLAMDDRGILIVTVGYGADAADASASPIVRRLTPYREAAGELEVLTPFEAQVLTPVPGVDEWLHVDPLPSLRVTAAPVAGS